MNVINWLLANNMDWELLKEEFGIKTTHYPEQDLHVLNYSQIDSPKMHPIVRECRGLVLDYDLNIVARPFDRFFNRGEADTAQYEGMLLRWFDKLDGSFIKVYMHGGVWYAGTRGTAFGESEVNGFGITFQELVFKALKVENLHEFNWLCTKARLIPGVTYMFELTAVENRVVTRYTEPRMGVLAARNNKTGEYLPREHLKRLEPFCDVLEGVGGTPEFMTIKANQLTGLQEGFVGYLEGQPVMKIKADAYVAIHHLRGEGLNPKRISELVATGETEEYLTYFPEDEPTIRPYGKAYLDLLKAMQDTYEVVRSIEDQKEFALAVKSFSFASILFMARRNNAEPTIVFAGMPLNYRAKAIREYM